MSTASLSKIFTLCLILVCFGCASLAPAVQTMDGAVDQSLDADVAAEPLAEMDRADAIDAPDDARDVIADVDGGYVPFDAPPDALDRPVSDSVADVPSDWPVVALTITTGRDCNSLRIHGTVSVINRTTPYAELLTPGRIRDGVYHLSQVEFFPSPTSPTNNLGVAGMTMRVVGTGVEFGWSYGRETLFNGGLTRYNCLINERGRPDEQCLYTCPESKRMLNGSPFLAYEATPEQVRLWQRPYLYTLRWMGPP